MRPPGARGGRRRTALRGWWPSGIGAGTEEVLVCQTGLIGIPFPLDAVLEAGPRHRGGPGRRRRGGGQGGPGHHDHRHRAARRSWSTGDGFTVGGMAKGAAMLAPNMATMLAVLTTDAAVDPATLHGACARPWPPLQHA